MIMNNFKVFVVQKNILFYKSYSMYKISFYTTRVPQKFSEIVMLMSFCFNFTLILL